MPLAIALSLLAALSSSPPPFTKDGGRAIALSEMTVMTANIGQQPQGTISASIGWRPPKRDGKSCGHLDEKTKVTLNGQPPISGHLGGSKFVWGDIHRPGWVCWSDARFEFAQQPEQQELHVVISNGESTVSFTTKNDLALAPTASLTSTVPAEVGSTASIAFAPTSRLARAARVRLGPNLDLYRVPAEANRVSFVVPERWRGVEDALFVEVSLDAPVTSCVGAQKCRAQATTFRGELPFAVKP